MNKHNMTQKNIFILLGHPDADGTLSSVLADEYQRGAEEAGHTVRRMNIGELQFDPILHKGYKEIQELEPDLVRVQENMKWAEHMVILYPNWWCSMPALLKGMFDRMFLPGFAFKFKKDSTGGWEKLLEGRTARVVISLNHPPLKARLLFGDYTNELRRGILGFAGIWPVHLTKIGPVQNVSDEKREEWKRELYRLGKLAT